MELPKRKDIRLKTYDYNASGFYFITICTDNHKPLFWDEVGAVIGRPQEVPLNEKGEIVEQAIKDIPKYYPMYYVDNYVIMPDHIHLLLQIVYDYENGRPMTAPTISTVINQLKGQVSKQLGFKVWQKSFFDHIIRNQKDYIKHYNYIETNPILWEEDKI